MAATVTSQAPPDTQQLRADIEATRASYHALVDATPDDLWRTPAGGLAWTRGEVLYHLANSSTFIARMTENVRRGGGLNPTSVMPLFLINLVSERMTRSGARKATRDSLKRQHDEAMAQFLATLEKTARDDWRKTVRHGGERFTLEGLFRLPEAHLREHAEHLGNT